VITVGTVVTHAGFYNHFDAAHHTLRVHTAPPVRVVCGLGRLLTRSRGQFDLLPAGQRERWRDLDPGEAVDRETLAKLNERDAARRELEATQRWVALRAQWEQGIRELEALAELTPDQQKHLDRLRHQLAGGDKRFIEKAA